MWANAKRNCRPVKYSWRPLFNAAKFGWRPLLDCRAVTLPRRETRWNLMGCPKLANRSQPLVGRSSPYYDDMWRRHCCLTSFFPIVDAYLRCEDASGQGFFSCHYLLLVFIFRWIKIIKVVWWCRGGDFCVLYFQRAACSTFQTCILNSH